MRIDILPRPMFGTPHNGKSANLASRAGQNENDHAASAGRIPVKEPLEQQVEDAVRSACAGGQSGEIAAFTAGQFSFVLAIGDDATLPFSTVHWVIESEGSSRLVVSARLAPSGRADYVAIRLGQMMPLIIAYHEHRAPKLGEVYLNLEDYANHAGLALCSNRDDAYLLPDTEFIAARGYAQFRREIEGALPAWPQRENKAFWRGSTTGLVWQVPGWGDLPRVKMCAIARDRPDLFDAGISSVVQIEHHAAEIAAGGLMKAPVPAARWGEYRYQIDVDGNSNAWTGFYQRLLTGSPVIKVASPSGFRQWFYDRMEPWRDYVPVASNMVDLIEKVEWLIAHQDQAQAIGEAGRRLALSMTYETEMRGAVRTIADAVEASVAAMEASV